MADDRAKELLAQLADGCAALETSEGWQRWLAAQAKFHSYSFGNVMLIGLQRPDATQVAGFHRWLELGRHVRKGEHGIRILAPMVVKVKATEENGAEGDERRVVGFKVATVFDLAQTDGDPLPAVPVTRLQGEAPGEVVADLIRFAHAEGFEVSFVSAATMGERNGDTNTATKRIRISDGLSGAQSAKTLAHELGHALMHCSGELANLPRAQAEVEAESVAYLVCQRIGIASADYSFGYVAVWAGREKVSAAGAIQASGQRIVRAAQRITDGLESRAKVGAAA